MYSEGGGDVGADVRLLGSTRSEVPECLVCRT